MRHKKRMIAALVALGLALARTAAFAQDFGGVGVVSSTTTADCTGVAISPTAILTAAHCFASNGQAVDPKTLSFQGIQATEITLAPGFDSFGEPNLDNDLAVLTLSEALPEGVPIYGVSFAPVAENTQVTFVRQSGVAGTARLDIESVDFSQTTYLLQPFLNDTINPSLIEGDSGGPVFIFEGGIPMLIGLNTFVLPDSGAIGGGILLAEYEEFLTPFLAIPEPASTSAAGFLLGLTWLGLRRKRQ